MKIVAHRGNRLHAPENTHESLISAYTAGADTLQFDVGLSDDGRAVVSRDASSQNGSSELRPLLEALPDGVTKMIELRPDPAADEGQRQELVERAMEPIAERGLGDDVIVYARDPELLQLAQQRAPFLAICTYDWERSPGEQVDLMEEHHADGLVIELDAIFGRGQLNEVGERLARLHSERDFRIGAVIYLNRDEPVFTEAEFKMLRKYALVYGAATDSMCRVAAYARTGIAVADEPVESPGRGLGLAGGIEGNFVAEVDHAGAGAELAVLNVDPGGDDDVFFEPGGVPPLAGIAHAADGYRLVWNLGADRASSRQGEPAGGGGTAGGRLRLERRGPWFCVYFQAGDEGDWVCAGVVRNDSLNPRVFLRCVGEDASFQNLAVTRYPS